MPLQRVRLELQRQERLGFLQLGQQLRIHLLVQVWQQEPKLREVLLPVQGWCWQLARNP